MGKRGLNEGRGGEKILRRTPGDGVVVAWKNLLWGSSLTKRKKRKTGIPVSARKKPSWESRCTDPRHKDGH